MLHRLAELDGEMRDAYAQFDYKRVVARLTAFLNTDLSAFYFDIRKDTLYCEPPSSEKRRAALEVIEQIFRCVTLWLAPVQLAVLTITDRQAAYAPRVVAALKSAGFRALADLRNEKITYKIREHSLQKLPYQIILGDKEMQTEQVAVRTRAGEDLGAMPLEALMRRLEAEMASRC
jgi:isoleucyl-tRNA synthetase